MEGYLLSHYILSVEFNVWTPNKSRQISFQLVSTHLHPVRTLHVALQRYIQLPQGLSLGYISPEFLAVLQLMLPVTEKAVESVAELAVESVAELAVEPTRIKGVDMKIAYHHHLSIPVMTYCDKINNSRSILCFITKTIAVTLEETNSLQVE